VVQTYWWILSCERRPAGRVSVGIARGRRAGGDRLVRRACVGRRVVPGVRTIPPARHGLVDDRGVVRLRGDRRSGGTAGVGRMRRLGDRERRGAAGREECGCRVHQAVIGGDVGRRDVERGRAEVRLQRRLRAGDAAELAVSRRERRVIRRGDARDRTRPRRREAVLILARDGTTSVFHSHCEMILLSRASWRNVSSVFRKKRTDTSCA
jgi:hypothetical protein